MKQKQKSSKQLVVAIILIAVLALIVAGNILGQYLTHRPPESDGPFCTMEAKICPDGSAVGRGGPNCAFESCPGESDATKNE